MEDTNYYERAAQVLIEDARAIRLADCGEADEYHDKIIQAIQLLVMADITENG